MTEEAKKELLTFIDHHFFGDPHSFLKFIEGFGIDGAFKPNVLEYVKFLCSKES